MNFKLNDNYLFEQINKLNEDFTGEIASSEFAGKTVICEFSDPNPFKVLHVGHLYTSIVGDSISKLFEYAGAKVIRANFGGDVGLHVAKTMYILQQKPIENLTIEDIAKCYVEGTNAYETDETAKELIDFPIGGEEWGNAASRAGYSNGTIDDIYDMGPAYHRLYDAIETYIMSEWEKFIKEGLVCKE